MKRLKVFFINTIILILTSIMLRVIGIFFNIYISNKIGNEALGLFQLIMSVYLFGITFACSGINIAATKVISEEIACGNKTSVNQITKKCIIISLITGVIGSAIMWISADFITTYCLHNRISKKVIYIICISLPFISMSSAMNGYFTALRKIYKNTITRFFEHFIKIIVTAYILNLFFPADLEYACYSLVLGDVISEVVSFIFQYLLYLYEKRKNYRVLDTMSYTYTRRILRVSMPVAFASYIRSGLSTLKQILIPNSLERSGLNCSIAISKYGIITGKVMPILMFPCVFIDSFSTLLIPEYSRYHIKKDNKRMKQVTVIVLGFTFLISLVFMAIFFFFSEKIAVWIYKDIEIGIYIKVLSIIVPFIYLDIVIDSILKGIDEQVKVMIINVLDLVVSVIFIHFFVPIFGFNGYVFSIFLSELLNFFFSSYILIKHMRKCS